jgi:hypothetical protein
VWLRPKNKGMPLWPNADLNAQPAALDDVTIAKDLGVSNEIERDFASGGRWRWQKRQINTSTHTTSSPYVIDIVAKQ